MALEGRESIRRMYAYWDFTRELTGSTGSSKQALADRVRNPPKAASIEDLDVKIIHWEEDLKSHELFESGGADGGDDEDGVKKVKMIMPESMKLSTVKKMLPKEVMDVVKLHNPKSYQALRDIGGKGESRAAAGRQGQACPCAGAGRASS